MVWSVNLLNKGIWKREGKYIMMHLLCLFQQQQPILNTKPAMRTFPQPLFSLCGHIPAWLTYLLIFQPELMNINLNIIIIIWSEDISSASTLPLWPTPESIGIFTSLAKIRWLQAFDISENNLSETRNELMSHFLPFSTDNIH